MLIQNGGFMKKKNNNILKHIQGQHKMKWEGEKKKIRHQNRNLSAKSTTACSTVQTHL